MALQVVRSNEPPLTYCTGVGQVTRVQAPVDRQMRLPGEALLTNLTGEWSLPRVNAEVGLQVASLVKHFSTSVARECATRVRFAALHDNLAHHATVWIFWNILWRILSGWVSFRVCFFPKVQFFFDNFHVEHFCTVFILTGSSFLFHLSLYFYRIEIVTFHGEICVGSLYLIPWILQQINTSSWTCTMKSSATCQILIQLFWTRWSVNRFRDTGKWFHWFTIEDAFRRFILEFFVSSWPINYLIIFDL